jgi:transcriptional regulator with XRE-family HTH domain
MMKPTLMVSDALRRAVADLRSRGVRQYELARDLGIHPSLISHLVNGSIPIRPHDERVLRLAAALGVPPDQAFATAEDLTGAGR